MEHHVTGKLTQKNQKQDAKRLHNLYEDENRLVIKLAMLYVRRSWSNSQDT